MAGGPNAAVVACMRCGEKALRISEGLESDYYKCSDCGETFSIDWECDGPADKPCWPPSKEWNLEFQAVQEQLNNRNCGKVRDTSVSSGKGSNWKALAARIVQFLG